jgi:hypothetical protein
MLKPLLLLLLFIPSVCFAQIKISGEIIGANDKKPIANASVFLSNATIGNKTADDGTFTLYNVKPGQYDLIVTVLGFETHSQSLSVTNDNIALGEISISPKTILLQEVAVRPNLNRQRDLGDFLYYFLGQSNYSRQCTIVNPEVVDVEYNKSTKVLTASTDDFLIIENKALGYKIKYKLLNFTYDAQRSLYFEGISLFEPLNGTATEQNKWKRNRLDAYAGSPMHFLRAAIAGRLDEDGFKTLRLERSTAPDYLQKKGIKYIQTLYMKEPLSRNDFVNLADKPGIFAMGFKDYLYVIYTKKRISYNPGGVYRPAGIAPDQPVTIIRFDEPYAFFDNNGIIINPHSVTYEGDFGIKGISDLLPIDYAPEADIN